MRNARVMQLLLVVLVLSFCGCSSNNEGKLEGTYWSSNRMKYMGHTIPAGAMRLEFKKSGDVVYQTAVGTFKGKYSYGVGDRVVFELERELAGRKKHVEKIKIDENTMTMVDSDGTTATFRLAGSW